MFVWLFHRVSGLVLIVLLAGQMITGMIQTSRQHPEAAEAARSIHTHYAVVALLALVIAMHGMYGVRTILYDLGIKRERLLFWTCTVVGVLAAVAYLVVFSLMC